MGYPASLNTNAAAEALDPTEPAVQGEYAEAPAEAPFVETFERGWEGSPDPFPPKPALPRLDADTDHGDDCLGVEAEARAFARIICSRQTGTPLSIGLFGDWGSGKSFFMGLIKREIEARGQAFGRVAQALETDGDVDGRTALDGRWHARVAQITFNAWHYAEPNLWASLVTRVFDELAELVSPEESIEDTRTRLLWEVSDGKQRRKQAEAELHKAEQLLVEAQAERERREAALTELRDELAVVEVVSPDDATAKADAETTDSAAPPRPQLAVGSPMAALRVTLRWVWARGRWTRVGLVAAVALLVLGALLTLAWWREWIDLSPEIAMATSACGVIVGILSTLAAWISLIRPKLETAKKAHRAFVEGKAKTDAFLDRAITDLLRPDAGPAELARHRFETAQAELRSASLAADQAAGQIAHSRRLLAQLSGGRRFYDFINDRDESHDYRQHLGLVSLIREDFEQLERILTQVEHEGPGDDDDPAPISRIVLYIDDLDRCEPERVVEVLQAVHLLLATPIFVVVVAVDVRWLRRSLTLHYDRLLQSHSDGSDDHPDEARPTAKNYLEKIFQIPFSLRPMGPAGFSSLVETLVRADLDNGRGTASETNADPGGALEPSPDAAGEADASADPHHQDQELTTDIVVSLEPQEVEFMQGLHAVIDTPRLGKGLVNTYRLLRAELPPAELQHYLGHGEYRRVLTLLAIQVGRSAEASTLFDAIGRTSVRTLGELMRELAARPSTRPERWTELHAALRDIGFDAESIESLRPWTDRIRRFSFHPWPTG